MATLAENKELLAKLKSQRKTAQDADEQDENLIADLSKQIKELTAEIKKAEGVTLTDKPSFELGKSVKATMADITAKAEAIEKLLGATPILSGLGLEDGEYIFTTSKDADFAVLRPVTSTKTGKNVNWLLSGVCGTVTGAKLVGSKSFDEKTLFAIPLDTVKKCEPDTAYKFTVKDSRVILFLKALTPAKAE